MPSFALFSRLRAEESGFTIIEVVMSAMVVVVLSVGVLKSLDTANARSGYQKDKGVAAGLAQQDQERLRAFRAQDLNNYTETRCIQKRSTGFVKDPECNDSPTLGPIYTVISRTDWVSDSSGTRPCGAGSRADYIRISSTVTWATTDTAESSLKNRVAIASLVAPRVGSFADEGTLSIEIRDRNGAPRANIPVNVTGPQNVSGITDANGCLFFGYLDPGNYTVAVNQANNVDYNGIQSVSRQFGVSAGSITAAVIEYDLGANLTVNFQTRKGTTNVASQKADHLSIAHSSLASPMWRSYTSNVAGGAPDQTYSLGTEYTPKLFPFTTGYSVYSGNCPGNSPSFWNISSTVPTGNTWAVANTFATLTPGGTGAITVHEPSVRLNPTGAGWPDNPNISGTQAMFPADALVILRAETAVPAGLNPMPVPAYPAAGTPTYCSGSKSYLSKRDAPTHNHVYLANAAQPTPYDFGVPVGAYDVCVVYPYVAGGNSATRYRWLTDTEANGTPAGNGVRPLDNSPSASTSAALNVPLPATDPSPDSAFCP